jgi:hypothetical protein
MRTIRVRSIAGLNYSLPDIWKLKPVLCIGTEAWQIVPFKAQTGELIQFVDKSEQKVEIRAIQIRPLAK